METPVQKADRLLGALEEMIGREETYLHTRNFDLVDQLRERTAPLVHQLVELSSLPGVSEFRPRVALLVGRSARHSQILDEKMRELSAELKQADRSRQRAAQFVPAYLQGTISGTARFQAAG